MALSKIEKKMGPYLTAKMAREVAVIAKLRGYAARITGSRGSWYVETKKKKRK